jgi:uncharacterized integral membrane protein
MIRFLRLLLALVGVIVIVILSVNHRQHVDIVFWPLPHTFSVPLYAVLLFGVILGALLGGTALWLSSWSDRRETRALRRRVQAIEYQERLRREREEAELLEQARRKSEALALPPSRPAAA